MSSGPHEPIYTLEPKTVLLFTTESRSTIFKCPLCWNTTMVFYHGQPMLESHSSIPTHFHPMTEDHHCFHSVNICEIYSD